MPRGLALWPGLYTSMVGAARNPWPAEEVMAQVALMRRKPATDGHIHFSLIALAQDRDGLATRLAAGPYAQAALVPAFLPPGDTPSWPGPPQWQAGRHAAADGDGWRLAPAPGAPPALWAIWRRQLGQWRFAVQPASQPALARQGADRVVVSAVTRQGLESERIDLAGP
jgi:hypothetical protein